MIAGICFILAACFGLWHWSNVTTANAMIKSGKYKNVRYGWGPLLVAAILAVIGIAFS